MKRVFYKQIVVCWVVIFLCASQLIAKCGCSKKRKYDPYAENAKEKSATSPREQERERKSQERKERKRKKEEEKAARKREREERKRKKKLEKEHKEKKRTNKKKKTKKTEPVLVSLPIDTRSELNEIYSGITGFLKLSPDERGEIEGHYSKKTSTYGEILYDSLETILDDMPNVFHEKAVVYDLGSGVGKFVAQVYLNTPVKKAVGIELSETRFKGAEQALKKFKDRGLTQKGRKILFKKNDFLKEKLRDADVIYMCSTCFAPELMDKLVKKFSKLKKGLTVITLKALPDYEQHGFSLMRQYQLPMSWSRQGKKSAVHVYRLQ